LRKSTLRLEQGESNIWKDDSWKSIWSGKIQLLELQSDYKIALTHFKYLLNTDKDLVPFSRYLKSI
jgi:cobalt-zinc-cadmium resistance protein CzcA